MDEGVQMFQIGRRAWTNSLFRSRSENRDSETDFLRAESIFRSIDMALIAAERELTGLTERLDDVLARAAVTGGDRHDEYLTREPLDTQHQRLFDQEIKNGERRINEISRNVLHFKFLKTTFLSRFPEFGNDTEPASSAAQRLKASRSKIQLSSF